MLACTAQRVTSTRHSLWDAGGPYGPHSAEEVSFLQRRSSDGRPQQSAFGERSGFAGMWGREKTRQATGSLPFSVSVSLHHAHTRTHTGSPQRALPVIAAIVLAMHSCHNVVLIVMQQWRIRGLLWPFAESSVAFFHPFQEKATHARGAIWL